MNRVMCKNCGRDIYRATDRYNRWVHSEDNYAGCDIDKVTDLRTRYIVAEPAK